MKVCFGYKLVVSNAKKNAENEKYFIDCNYMFICVFM